MDLTNPLQTIVPSHLVFVPVPTDVCWMFFVTALHISLLVHLNSSIAIGQLLTKVSGFDNNVVGP